MMTKCLIFFAALVAVCSGGALPLALPAAVPAPLTIGTYATSYNAHAVNHAIAAPYVAAAAPPALGYSAYAALSPAAYQPFGAYSAYPAYTPYSAPLLAGRR